MKESLNQLMERLLSGTELTRQEMLWGGLVVGLGLATLQMIVMLVTRWGDRNPSSKALMISLLIHLSTGLGVVVMRPGIATEFLEPSPPPAEEEIVVQKLELLDNVERPSDQAGNTPVWKQLPKAEMREIARVDRPMPKLEELEIKQRPRPQQELAMPNLPHLDTSPQEDQPRPDLLHQGDLIPRSSASPEPEMLDLPEPNPTPQSDPNPQPSSSIAQRLKKRGKGTFESEVQRDPSRGSVDVLRPEFKPDRTMAALDAPELENPDSFLRKDNTTESFQPRTGPEPNALPSTNSGMNTPKPREVADSGDSTAKQFSRLRKKPRRTSQTPTQQPQEIDRNRPGDLAPPQEMLAMNSLGVPELDNPGPTPELIPTDDTVGDSTANRVPQLYQLRDAQVRKKVTAQNGGTNESEKAVEASLKWLAAVQSLAGNWDANRWGSGLVRVDEEGVDRQNAGREADTGLTGLTVLAFLGAGYTHEKGPYQKNVENALRWLIKQQDESGFLGGNATHYARMYCHGMATYALAEAYGMSDAQSRQWLRGPLEKAIEYTLDFQHDTDGGWRYEKGKMGDMSMFGWHLMALKSAEINGIPIPEKHKQLMSDFLRTHSLGSNKGLAAYRPGKPITPAMTAEALFCKQMLGLKRDDPQSKEAVEYLTNNLPRRSRFNLYYWYYGTLAMRNYGGRDWDQWNNQVRELLIREQRQVGTLAGSWDPDGPWGRYGGRIYSTALSTLSLEVYYRFLPLYKLSDPVSK